MSEYIEEQPTRRKRT